MAEMSVPEMHTGKIDVVVEGLGRVPKIGFNSRPFSLVKAGVAAVARLTGVELKDIEKVSTDIRRNLTLVSFSGSVLTAISTYQPQQQTTQQPQ